MKHLRKTLAILLSMIICVVMQIPSYADNTHTDSAEIRYMKNNVLETVNSLSNSKQIQYKIINTYYLKSLSGGDGYTFFELYPSGFAICDNYSGEIEELSPVSERLPYNFSENAEYYFAGPMNYCVRTNDKIYDIETGYCYTDEDIDQIATLEQEIKSLRSSIKGVEPPDPLTEDYYYMLSYAYFDAPLNIFGNNTSGTCVQLACAILLGYYDNYVNGSFITNPNYVYGNGTTEAFHQHLQSWMGTGSISFSNAKTGLESYLASIYFTTPTVTICSTGYLNVLSVVSERISHDRPAVIGMNQSYNASAPYDHACVVYGYIHSYTSTSSMYFYTVHTGWHPSPLEVWNYYWFGEALTIS